MIEDSPQAASTPSTLEAELTAHIWNYYRDKRWRVSRHVVGHLHQLSGVALKLGEAIEREGIPIQEKTRDRQLAREARQLGWSLIHRAALLDDGKGSEPIMGAQTEEPYEVKTGERTRKVSVRVWVRSLTEESGDRTLTAQMQRQHDAEIVLEMKANLLASLEACKRLYNALKTRKPQESASDERKSAYRTQKHKARLTAQRLFDELLPKAMPGPLTAEIKTSAKEALAAVLVDRGNDARIMPSAAIVGPIQAATEKYLGRKVASDLVRQAAAVVRKEVQPDPIVVAAIAEVEVRYGVPLRPDSQQKPIR